MTTRFTLGLFVAFSLLAFQLGAFQPPPPRATRSAPPGSIAVLPFKSPKDLHDGVKHHLADWVRHVPITLLDDSPFRIARPDDVIDWQDHGNERATGKRLGVATVLAGRVEVQDERLHVHAELIEVETGLLLWTKSWVLDDVFTKNEALPKIRDEMIVGVGRRLLREVESRQARK